MSDGSLAVSDLLNATGSFLNGIGSVGSLGTGIASTVYGRQQQLFDNWMSMRQFNMQKDLAYNGSQIKAKDLEKAGLSPTLLTGANPSTVQNTGTGTAPQGIQNPELGSALFQLLEAKKLATEIDNLEKTGNNIDADTDVKEAQAQNIGPTGSYAGIINQGMQNKLSGETVGNALIQLPIGVMKGMGNGLKDLGIGIWNGTKNVYNKVSQWGNNRKSK